MSDRTALGSFLRAEQARCQELCGKETLDYGIAYYSAAFAALPEACQLREVWVPDASKLSAAFEQTEAWFSAQGLRCLRWAPAEAQDSAGLNSMLGPRGFSPRTSMIYQLARWVEGAAPREMRILPARAMRTAFRDTFDDGLAADAGLERLDDPQLDMFVALREKRAVGRGGLYQVGDIAQVVDLDAKDSEAAHSLLRQVLTLAKRLALPMVLADTRHDDPARQSLLDDAGFVHAADYVSFERMSA